MSNYDPSAVLKIEATDGFLYEKVGNQYHNALTSYPAKDILQRKFFLHGHAASGGTITVTHESSGAIDKARFAVLTVEAVNVDATTPGATIVKYKVTGGILPSSTFTAPGKIETRSNISEGEFTFTFNQNELSTEDGENSINLQTAPCGLVRIAATRAAKADSSTTIRSGRVTTGDGMINILVTHEFAQGWHLVTYSVPVVAGSKTVWAKGASVNISTLDSPDLPSDVNLWMEQHFYNDSSGSQLEKFMTLETGSTLPPQSDHFKSAKCTDEFWFTKEPGRTANALIFSIMMKGDTGPMSWISLSLNPKDTVNID